jgi:hypothetical protein
MLEPFKPMDTLPSKWWLEVDIEYAHTHKNQAFLLEIVSLLSSHTRMWVL